MELPKEASVTGVQVAYYAICKRKLWLFSHKITMEHTSEKVAMGRMLHEESYGRKKKEVGIGSIKVDFVENKGEIHEVKKSKSLEEAHEWQMLYYLYYFKKLGMDMKGKIDYPLTRQRVDVTLTEEKEKQLEQILWEIQSITGKDSPQEPVKLPYCKSCSYFNFCWC